MAFMKKTVIYGIAAGVVVAAAIISAIIALGWSSSPAIPATGSIDNVSQGMKTKVGNYIKTATYYTITNATTPAVGYVLTIISMLKTVSLRQAARVTLVGDTASISAMEIITENSLVFLIPGYSYACRTGCDILARNNIASSRLCGFSYPAMCTGQ